MKLKFKYSNTRKHEMKIAFIGDSFCSGKASYSWCMMLSRVLNANILAMGNGGSNIWDAYKQLISVIDECDVIVMCHTNHSRIPNRKSYPLTPGVVDYHLNGSKTDVPGDFTENAIWNAAANYYAHLYDDEYHWLTKQLLVQEMDSLLLRSNKVCIHFGCFDRIDGTSTGRVTGIATQEPLSYVTWPKGYWEPKSGAWAKQTLIEYRELNGLFTISTPEVNENHMTIDMNAELASLLEHIIKNKKTGSFDLPGFSKGKQND